jgi:hypothetical protein
LYVGLFRISGNDMAVRTFHDGDLHAAVLKAVWPDCRPQRECPIRPRPELAFVPLEQGMDVLSEPNEGRLTHGLVAFAAEIPRDAIRDLSREPLFLLG